MDSGRHTIWGRRLYSRLPLIGGWLRLRAVDKLARDGSPEAVRLLAEAVARGDDRRVCVAALEALQEVERPRCVEAVCAVWAATRNVYLEELLTVAGWVAQAPIAVRVLYQLHKGRQEEAAAGGAEVVAPLLQLCADPDAAVATRARDALGRLQAAEAREALCRLVIDRDDATARELALAAGYAPREAGQRTLFYFLTGQWDAYEALDFDRSLLRAVYQAADPRLRQRIAERARAAGRVEWVEVVTGGRQQLRLAEMTDAEWQATLEVLVSRGQWAELWRLAREAPARWAARLLQQLDAVAGLTAESAAADLKRLATAWQEPNLASVLRPQTLAAEAEVSIRSLVISLDSRLLAAGGEDGRIQLWSLPEARFLRWLEGHTSAVDHLAISPRGRVLVSADAQGVVRFWGLPEGTAFPPLPRPAHTASVSCLEISPKGKFVASGGLDKTICLWDLAEHAPRQIWGNLPSAVHCLAFSPDGRLLASGGWDDSLVLWDPNEGRVLHVARGHDGHPPLHLTFTPAGDLLASCSAGGDIRLLGLSEGTERQALRGHVGAVCALAVDPSGHLLASGGQDTTVRLWRLPDGQLVHALAGHIEPIWALAFSPDGQVLASGSIDGTVELWGLPDGRSLRTLAGKKGLPLRLAVSPDGLALAAAASGGIQVWAAELARLSRIPVGRLSPQDLAWLTETLAGDGLTPAERLALEFITALACWRRRFDILLDEGPRRVAAGEFDIILAG